MTFHEHFSPPRRHVITPVSKDVDCGMINLC